MMQTSPLPTPTPIRQTKTVKSLADRIARWSVIMRHEATGPLVIASEVCEVIDTWEDYSQGEISVGAWLKSIFGHSGRGTKYWRDRANAVEDLDVRGDGSIARTLHHHAAVWLAGMPADGSRQKVLSEIFVLCKEQKHEPVTSAQAKRVYFSIVGKPKREVKKTACEDCEKLRELLRSNGIEVPEGDE